MRSHHDQIKSEGPASSLENQGDIPLSLILLDELLMFDSKEHLRC